MEVASEANRTSSEVKEIRINKEGRRITQKRTATLMLRTSPSKKKLQIEAAAVKQEGLSKGDAQYVFFLPAVVRRLSLE